eukprot:gb/GECG01011355.1/.p1 GENE.gb/GECG01011355.1/~~gb/GECG01011355.1/.p1  ORF type:complete len:128 (+),score=0.83 gb/GECG01011355.1/:1-384(+)
MDGNAPSILWGFVITPSLSGTLKSTRIRTLFWERLMASRDSLFFSIFLLIQSIKEQTHTHLHKKARLQTDQWMYENFRPRLDNPVCIPVLCQPEGQLHTRQREGEPRCRLQQIARRLVVRYTTIRDI